MTSFIKNFKKNIHFLLFIFLTFSYGNSHEFWIEPLDYEIQKSNIEAHLRVGQVFQGMSLMYNPQDFQEFKILSGSKNKKINVDGLIGDVPAMNFKPNLEGLLIIYHETNDKLVNYKKFSKFQSFVMEKGYQELIDTHLEKNFPQENFIESYRRYAKSLVAFNGTKGKDKKTGLLFEFVLSNNPYEELQDSLIEATLFYKKKPLIDNLVTVFIKEKNGYVKTQQLITDENGRISFSINEGEQYLLDSVIILPVNGNVKNKEPIWHSVWASTTFEVPKSELEN